MFDRPKYKMMAKKDLSKHFKIPVLITLIVSGILILYNIIMVTTNIAQFVESDDFNLEIFKIISRISTMYILIFFLCEYTLEYTQTKFYIHFTKNRETATFSVFLEAFSSWFKAIRAGFWTALWLVLWGFLFIIPAYIKFFAYSQIFYLLAEYPSLSVRKALKISIAITKGYKGELFVMHLSFLGWSLLANLAAGIGYLWLIPYMRVSFTHSYYFLKENALKRGIITELDLTNN